MPNYSLSTEAKKDLQDIARYSLSIWGETIFKQYQAGLKNTFRLIGKKEVIEKNFSNKFPELMVTKYRYHFIFYIIVSQSSPIIIGIIHEQRDIVERLSERLK